MKNIIKSIIVYFPLAFYYKMFGNYYNNYWVNSYWFISSLFFGFIFLSIYLILLKDKNKYHIKDFRIYSVILLSMACYWGVMSLLRLYLFFNIELYLKLISSAGKITTGGISIIIIMFILTANIIWHRK